MADEERADVFCRTCRTNQTLLLAITANWEAEKGESTELDGSDGSQDEQDDDLAFQEWRQQLEQRYPPVCIECLPRVEESLKQADRQARALIWNGFLRESQRRRQGDVGGVRMAAKGAARVSLKSREVSISSSVRPRRTAGAPDLSALSLDPDVSSSSALPVPEQDDGDDAQREDRLEDSMDWSPTLGNDEIASGSRGVLLGPQRFFEPLKSTGLEDLLADKLGLFAPELHPQTPDGDTVMTSAASLDRQYRWRRRRRHLAYWLLALLALTCAFFLPIRKRHTDQIAAPFYRFLAELQQWWNDALSRYKRLEQDNMWAGLQP